MGSEMARFVVRRLVSMVLRPVRRLGDRLPDLHRAARRRPGGADGGQDPDRDPGRSDPRGVGLRRTALRPVRDDDEEPLHRRDGLLLQPAERHRRNLEGAAADALAGGRRGADLDGLRDRPRPLQRPARRPALRPPAHRAGADRDLDAGLLARRPDELLPRLQGGDLPQQRLRRIHREPAASGSGTW